MQGTSEEKALAEERAASPTKPSTGGGEDEEADGDEGAAEAKPQPDEPAEEETKEETEQPAAEGGKEEAAGAPAAAEEAAGAAPAAPEAPAEAADPKPVEEPAEAEQPATAMEEDAPAEASPKATATAAEEEAAVVQPAAPAAAAAAEPAAGVAEQPAAEAGAAGEEREAGEQQEDGGKEEKKVTLAAADIDLDYGESDHDEQPPPAQQQQQPPQREAEGDQRRQPAEGGWRHERGRVLLLLGVQPRVSPALQDRGRPAAAWTAEEQESCYQPSAAAPGVPWAKPSSSGPQRCPTDSPYSPSPLSGPACTCWQAALLTPALPSLPTPPPALPAEGSKRRRSDAATDGAAGQLPPGFRSGRITASAAAEERPAKVQRVASLQQGRVERGESVPADQVPPAEQPSTRALMISGFVRPFTERQVGRQGRCTGAAGACSRAAGQAEAEGMGALRHGWYGSRCQPCAAGPVCCCLPGSLAVRWDLMPPPTAAARCACRQVRDLLSETGKVVALWMPTIKTHAYVVFETKWVHDQLALMGLCDSASLVGCSLQHRMGVLGSVIPEHVTPRNALLLGSHCLLDSCDVISISPGAVLTLRLRPHCRPLAAGRRRRLRVWPPTSCSGPPPTPSGCSPSL